MVRRIATVRRVQRLDHLQAPSKLAVLRYLPGGEPAYLVGKAGPSAACLPRPAGEGESCHTVPALLVPQSLVVPYKLPLESSAKLPLGSKNVSGRRSRSW